MTGAVHKIQGKDLSHNSAASESSRPVQNAVASESSHNAVASESAGKHNKKKKSKPEYPVLEPRHSAVVSQSASSSVRASNEMPCESTALDRLHYELAQRYAQRYGTFQLKCLRDNIRDNFSKLNIAGVSEEEEKKMEVQLMRDTFASDLFS